ncbi:hypothetical protein D3C86_1189300 [compost metagenome]
MFDEEGGNDHAHPVMHGAVFPQLPHAGIHDRITGHAARPGLEGFLVVPPAEGVETLVPVLLVQPREMKQQVIAELPPDDFLAETADIV